MRRVDALLKAGAGRYGVVLAAGDITIAGHEAYARDFVRTIVRHGTPLLAVPGNNDGAEVMETLRRADVSVHRRERVVGGVRFTGLGGDGTQPYEETLGEGEALGVDVAGSVFLTHIPPAKLRYAPDTASGARGPQSVELAVPPSVAAGAPRAWVCGHVHKLEGVAFLGPTKVVKVRATFWGSYAELDLETLRARFLRLPS